MLCDTDSMDINETTLYRHVGAAIRHHREVRGITQARLASAVGLLRTSIVNLEAGRQRAPLHTLFPICAVLGIEVADILPTVHAVLSEYQLVLPIDGVNAVVPARTAAFVNSLLDEQQEQDNV
jgi:DNA-binding XRE family transcriptional regulator